MTYKAKVIKTLEQLGGHAYLKDIYEAFESLYGANELPKSFKASIRATLERHSSDSDAYSGRDDLFYSVEGIGKGHWGLKNYIDPYVPELSQDSVEFSEGKLLLRKHLHRERNPKLIIEAKKAFLRKHNHLFCEVCGFDFKEKYGSLGENFIEAHHVKPVSTMADGETTKIKDIIMVCSNCHSMIHRRKPWPSKDELKLLLVE